MLQFIRKKISTISKKKIKLFKKCTNGIATVNKLILENYGPHLVTKKNEHYFA